MAIPSVQPFSQQPGGGLVTALRGSNALSQEMLETQIKKAQADYAPWTTYADAASKIAYSNLMGPQFMAKLMANDPVLANIPDAQKNAILTRLQQTALGGNALASPGVNASQQPGMHMPPPPSSQPSQNSLSGYLGNILRGFLGDSFQQPSSQNPLAQQPALSSQDQNAISNMHPGDSYVVQGQKPNSFAENVGSYKGVIKEGEEAGKIRAKDINDLNDIVFNADTQLATLNDINDMISSPAIREIRQLPLAGRHEMAYYAKEGTPEQQQLVGRLYAQMGNVVKNSVRDFPGQFRKGEQQLLNGMKPNDSDTVDAMIGKAESLTVMTKLLRERSALTSQFMNKYHMNKLEASELADKQLNGEQIRQDVHAKLNPMVSVRNRKTGEVKTVPIAEAKKLGVSNV